MGSAEEKLRGLPQVQRLLETRQAEELAGTFSRAALTAALREVLAEVRTELRNGLEAAPGADAMLAGARARLEASRRPGLRRVINATGIVLHTNLGRAPLAEDAAAAVADMARSYSNLELDLTTGSRGSRTEPVESLLRALTGAEAALAVNNGAAALLLALSALAGGGEVVVSRGELVEIGGGFRIPEVIQQGGARLVEVGSTNKTRLADYRAAITERTRVLLKVHQSNFRMLGFTEETGMAELAGLGREHGLKLVVDLGSGKLRGPGAEPTLTEAIAVGADLVTCSGDKLLGGPQAGLLIGSAGAIDRLRRHPLLRALRLDKMSLAALEATLRLHRDAPATIPVNRMLAQTQTELQRRAERLAALLGTGEIARTEGFAGGGSLPEERIPSCAVALRPPTLSATELARRLRAHSPAVVGRIVDASLLLDVLAVRDDELETIAQAVKAAS
ncbi:MAG TPA: L-seryl-tRNA(Sec) selenium transferase [Acetobacteraceae bacterium]|nr:L-seryl-tRNA(Sec) selenium transferase [Acetobacteraceae bacterium]